MNDLYGRLRIGFREAGQRGAYPDERTRDFQVEVSENNGIVDLRGKVPSEEDRREVERMVESQAGVVKVINNLQLLEEDTPVAEEDDFQALDDDDVPPVLPTRSE